MGTSRVLLHLHCTEQVPKKDGPAQLFRDTVHEQSIIDHAAFDEAFFGESGVVNRKEVANIAGPGLPWCWANRAKGDKPKVEYDVLWLSELTGTAAEPCASEEAIERHEDPSPTEKTKKKKKQKKNGNQWEELLRQSLSSFTVMSASSAQSATSQTDVGALVPVAFGRPNWEFELRAIGNAWMDEDISVYICGRMEIVKDVKDICIKLNKERRDKGSEKDYIVSFERFG